MKKIFKYTLVLIFMFMVLLITLGYFNNVVVIKPSNLLQGDAERLGSHLDMISGCVKLKYNGKKDILATYEIWEKGKLTAQGGPMLISCGFLGEEISVSISESKSIDTMRLKLMSNHAGITANIKGIDLFCYDTEKQWGYGPVDLQKTLYTSDSDEIAVWGVTAYNGYYRSLNASIYENVKAADWGLVIKLNFQEG